MNKNFFDTKNKKPILKKIVFAKSSILAKSDFLNLAKFGFWDIANFITFDKFSISLLLAPLLTLFSAFKYFHFYLSWHLRIYC